MSDHGLFGPGSVTWRVHAHPSMLVGGMRALLVEALHPLAMAGVDQHSSFRQDPWGRLQRTTNYVLDTTFGDTRTALDAGALVRRIHPKVRGIDPATGRFYRADDPALLLWVHAVTAHSFLAAYRRYGGGLSAQDADRYVAEQVRAAELVGLDASGVPSTHAELREYLRSMHDELLVTPPAREAFRLVLMPPLPLPLRPLQGLAAIPGAAAVGLMPRRLRAMYGIPFVPPADAAVALAAVMLTRALGLLPRAPRVREALSRARGLDEAV